MSSPPASLHRPGFTLVEALIALLVIGGAVAAVLPALGNAMRSKGEREADFSAVLAAQSLLDAYAPPGAAREGRQAGEAPEGRWSIEIGPGQAGAGGVVLRPVRVVLGPVILETLRPGPAARP
ncbi:type II secretion system protein [Roseomonas populi]|uniref:Type II secretion system GspH family protein n=1 Tax=Roseomonas populi TaxID=3121582 RepID=A0ABT1X7B8_9PROT|nr:type II secretion system protein [Roseomonas pecuniae]MCR0983641.1 type II secretion system GspH family protein [Roseomonas pecuniae]